MQKIDLDLLCMRIGKQVVEKLIEENINTKKIENDIRKNLWILKRQGIWVLEKLKRKDDNKAYKEMLERIQTNDEICELLDSEKNERLEDMIKKIEHIFLMKKIMERILTYSLFLVKNSRDEENGI